MEPAAEASRPEARIQRVTRLLVWTLVAAWSISSLWYPFGWDQGIFAWVGDTILHGGMPYRDAFDLKGPAAHVIFAIAQAIFGQNQWGIRVIDLLGIGSAAWLVARSVNRLTTPGTGAWAGALLILWYGGLTFWNTAQPDGFAAALLALGFLPILTPRADAGWRHAALAGLAVGICVAIKPTYAVFLLVPTILFVGRGAGRVAAWLPEVSVLVLASAVPVLAFIGWFAARGALDSLWEVYIEYNSSTYSSGSALALVPRLQGLTEYVLSGSVFPVVLPAAAVGTWVLAKRDAVAAAALVTWAALATANVVLQNKFFEYQWPALFVPSVILGAVGLHASIKRRSESDDPSPPASRALGIALFFVVFLHASIHPAFEVLNWVTHVAGVTDNASYYDTFGVPGNDYRMSEHIRASSSRDDRLFVMAWNAELLYTTDRESASRFGYSLPFWMGEGTDFQSRYRTEVMDTLRRAPPELIVVAPQALPLVGRNVDLEEFAQFARFLDDRYQLDVTFGDLSLYRLR